ncbi:hypothetical protein, partial [Arthrobacter sp. SO3]|uniref:hypothetical protein n=1 Tax=Arthrobacter sp. SO3 TaxID=1897057 RepID=UPI001CFF7A59
MKKQMVKVIPSQRPRTTVRRVLRVGEANFTANASVSFCPSNFFMSGSLHHSVAARDHYNRRTETPRTPKVRGILGYFWCVLLGVDGDFGDADEHVGFHGVGV